MSAKKSKRASGRNKKTSPASVPPVSGNKPEPVTVPVPAISGINKPAFTAWLESVSIAFLALPAFLFLLGFIRPLWGIPLAALLAVALTLYFRTANRGAAVAADAAPISRATLLWGLAATLVICMLLGAGGWGYQNGDWHKSNAFYTI